jgi:uncharacterized protein (DUF305 family)
MRTPHSFRRTTVVVALLASLAILAAACSSDDHGNMQGDMPGMEGTRMPGMDMPATVSTNPIPADAEFNAADVEFAQGMIVHHGQAVQMADMALANSQDPTVLDLATKIKAAQEPEIAQMSTWLTEWDQPVPDPMMAHGMLPEGGMPMAGMMDDQRMSMMQSMTGADFDEMFLTSMIEHHRGAIEMARYVIDNGEYPPLRDLAEAVISAQEAEIAEMEGMLDQQ